MTNIKFAHSGGVAYINLDQITRIQVLVSTITFYTSTTSYSFNLATADDALELVNKIDRITKTIDLDTIV